MFVGTSIVTLARKSQYPIFEDGGGMSETTIRELLQSEQEMLKAVLTVALDHPSTKGDHTEGAWIHFLKSFLPSKYSVAKGFVFDSHGNKSDQIDVIVYDGHHSPLIYKTDAGETYVTAESVYAVLECKQKLTSATVKYADEKAGSVTKLYRTSRGMFSSGKYQDPRELPHIIGGLLASRGKPESKLSIFEESSNLDICVSLEGVANRIVEDGGKRTTVSTTNSSDAIPSFYFSLLNSLHLLGTVPAIDIREYAKLCNLSLPLSEGV